MSLKYDEPTTASRTQRPSVKSAPLRNAYPGNQIFEAARRDRKKAPGGAFTVLLKIRFIRLAVQLQSGCLPHFVRQTHFWQFQLPGLFRLQILPSRLM